MEMLASQFAQLGHEVVLGTPVAGPEDSLAGVRLVRQPSTRQFLSYLTWCDVHLQANLSLRHLLPLALGTPFVVAHGTDYQRPDGRRALRDHAKLACARLVYGIACSRYIAQRVRCKEVINNSYDDAVFRTEVALDRRLKDIVFVGRLVSDKGCDTLLEALATLAGEGVKPSCTVIGDGPERGRLGVMAEAMELPVRFLGSMPPHGVAEQLNLHRIQVVPLALPRAFRYRRPGGARLRLPADRLGHRRASGRRRQPRPHLRQRRSGRACQTPAGGAGRFRSGAAKPPGAGAASCPVYHPTGGREISARVRASPREGGVSVVVGNRVHPGAVARPGARRPAGGLLHHHSRARSGGRLRPTARPLACRAPPAGLCRGAETQDQDQDVPGAGSHRGATRAHPADGGG
jgi:hypothetical protein